MRNLFGSEEYKKLSPIMKETFIKVNSESILNDVKNVDAPTLLMNFKDDIEEKGHGGGRSAYC